MTKRKRIPEAKRYIALFRHAGYTVIDNGGDMVSIEREGKRIGAMDLVNNLRLIGDVNELLSVIQRSADE